MKVPVWPHQKPPTLARFILILSKIAGAGALAGLVIDLLTGSHPAAPLGSSMAGGAIFALAFYLCCAFPWIFLGPLMHTFPKSIRHPLTALVGAIGSAAAITISVALSNRLPGVHNDWADNMGPVILGEAVAGAVIALLIGAFKKLRFAVIQAEAKAHDIEMRAALTAEAAAKAQAAALQSQINPHFFFNTLNTLSALIPCEATAAQEIVGRLADMFRYTLACSRCQSVTLEQELEFTENYLRLEQARFRERLRLKLPEGDFADIRLPGLSLQPLVENAIKYGVAKRLEGGAVEVVVRKNGASCTIDVFSPADGAVEPSRFFREGHALENVRDRLKLFAGKEAGVDIAGGGSERVRVSLVVPR